MYNWVRSSHVKIKINICFASMLCGGFIYCVALVDLNRIGMRTLAIVAAAILGTASSAVPRLRAPAVPLVVHDPFASVWSAADNLTDVLPSFWAGQTIGAVGMIRVDNQTFRWCGADTFSSGTPVPAAQQLDLALVTPLQTKYTFSAGGVQLLVTFTTPAAGNAWSKWVQNPISYLTLTVASIDGGSHDVQLYFEHTSELTVNDVTQNVMWSRNTPYTVPSAEVMRVGSASQAILQAAGDDMRISWGYQYLVIPSNYSTDAVSVSTSMTSWKSASLAFVSGGANLPADDPSIARAASDDWIVLAAAWDMGTVDVDGKSTYAVMAYEQLMSIEYFGAQLAPAWMQGGTRSMTNLLTDAIGSYTLNMANAAIFDDNEMAAYTAAANGDERYAQIAALAYRQVVGSMIFVSPPPKIPACSPETPLPGNMPWVFMEEQSSDGDVSTVDVLFPASPFLLYYSPETLWAALVPIMDYATNCTRQPQWNYNLTWAPHDLGTWPIARRGPMEQEQMPLEESGE